MSSVQFFLTFIAQNWTFIVVLIGMIVGFFQRIFAYIGKSKEERVEIAKAQIQEILLKLVTSAEDDFSEWNGAGEIKRSQVIEEVYRRYPILSKVVDQKEITAWLDNEIDHSLEKLKGVIIKNTVSGSIEDIAEYEQNVESIPEEV